MTERRTGEKPRICLLNMPFASLEAPSIGLTQLKGVLDGRFGTRVEVEVHCLNLEFLEFTDGLENYRAMISGQGRLAGAADWFFRQAAFPNASDNTEEYLARFYFDEEDKEARRARAFLSKRRPGVSGFLDTLIDRHGLADADVVGFTTLFFQTMGSLAMARRIKDRNPGVTTVMGGAACEAEMGREYARRCDQIDYVFSGPSLVSFPRFVERRLAGDTTACAAIEGVFSNANDTGTMGEDLDIDANVPLDYKPFLDKFEQTFPNGEVKPMLLFETSRGCRWGEKITCAFCGLNGLGMAYRPMAPEQALARIREMFEYVPRCGFILAVDTILPNEYLEDVFPRIEPPPGAAIMYEVRPVLTESQLAALCRAGVLVIQPGIEALSTDTLKRMRKGTTAMGNIRFLKTCARFPLRVEWNLLIGSPGEDKAVYEKYLRDLPLLAHLHPPGGAFPISFDRFSPYFLDPDSHGLDLRPQEFYAYAFPFEDAALSNIAYHFVDQETDREKLHEWLDRLNAIIDHWRLRWENRDGECEARLCLIHEGGESFIYDSRNGSEDVYPVTRTTELLLEYLDTPRSHNQVASHLGPPETKSELAFLRDRRLLFEEGERLISLVMRGGPGSQPVRPQRPGCRRP